jgi:flagellar basal-body rod protein FlgB
LEQALAGGPQGVDPNMLNRLSAELQFQEQALTLRAERQKLLAANIANADTPNYKARDMDFTQALAKATGQSASASLAGGAAALPADAGTSNPPRAPTTLFVSNAQHLSAVSTAPGQTYGTASEPLYRVPEQASMDGNTVDMDRERANFADNAVRFEATLRFINGSVRTILSAIRGD